MANKHTIFLGIPQNHLSDNCNVQRSTGTNFSVGVAGSFEINQILVTLFRGCAVMALCTWYGGCAVIDLYLVVGVL